MPRNPEWYPHPETGSPSSAPWCREDARRRKMPQYRSQTPCSTCDKPEPYRYVRSDVCVWCMGLDLTSVVKGEPLRVMQQFPEDEQYHKPGHWALAPGVTQATVDALQQELVEAGYDELSIGQAHQHRGHFVWVDPITTTGTPCAWGPHIRHLDIDGNCTSCAQEAPTARQQFTARIGSDLTAAECAARGLVLYRGRACVNGHEGWRLIKGDRCWECFDGGSKPVAVTAAAQFAEAHPVTYGAAKAEGLPLFLGNACRRGHTGWRRVKGRACYECGLGVAPALPADGALLVKTGGEWCDAATGQPVPVPPIDMGAATARAFGFKVVWSPSDGWQAL